MSPALRAHILRKLTPQHHTLILIFCRNNARISQKKTTARQKSTVAYRAYHESLISERHRHRYEVNPAYIERLAKKGLVFSGFSPDRKLMEIAELPDSIHPFFMGTQFHPEFQSRPLSPHPLFMAFLNAASRKKK